MGFVFKALGYLLTAAGPVVTFFLSKHTGSTEAITIGGAVSGVGGRLLHKAEPPGAPPSSFGSR